MSDGDYSSKKKENEGWASNEVTFLNINLKLIRLGNKIWTVSAFNRKDWYALLIEKGGQGKRSSAREGAGLRIKS